MPGFNSLIPLNSNHCLDVLKYVVSCDDHNYCYLYNFYNQDCTMLQTGWWRYELKNPGQKGKEKKEKEEEEEKENEDGGDQNQEKALSAHRGGSEGWPGHCFYR
jgi:hypothetical protein